MESFFQIRFRINDRKPKSIETNIEAWILIKVQSFFFNQCICLDKLYKLMESFFSKFWIRFLVFDWKLKNIRTIREAWILIKVHCVIPISMDTSRRALTNGKLFSNFGILFRINYNFFKISWVYACEGGGRHLCCSARILVYYLHLQVKNTNFKYFNIT